MENFGEPTIDAISENYRDGTLDLHIFGDNVSVGTDGLIDVIDFKMRVCLEFITSGEAREMAGGSVPIRIIVQYRSSPDELLVRQFNTFKRTAGELGFRLLVTVGEDPTKYRSEL